MRSTTTRTPTYADTGGGFTLPELMATIAIMGIIAAIAIPSWFGLIERRNVESAANQFSADVRLAHSRASNQLTDWRVIYNVAGAKITACTTANTPLATCPADKKATADYWLVKLGAPYPSVVAADTQRIAKNLPSGTRIVSSNLNPDTSSAGVISPATAGTTRTLEMNSDGTASALSGPSSGALTVVVGPQSGSGNLMTITVQRATSETTVG